MRSARTVAASMAVLVAAGCSDIGRSDPDELMARDAVNFFGQLCLSTEGNRRQIEERLSHATGQVTRVDDPEIGRRGAGRAAAWEETSPAGAGLRLLVDDVQFCSVDVAAASGPALHARTQAMLDGLYGDRGFRYRLASDDVDRETGMRRQRYLVRLPSSQPATIEVATIVVDRGLRSTGRLSFAFGDF